MTNSRRSKFKLLAMSGCAALALATAAHAQDQARFDIAGGDLKTALVQFAGQSNQEILFSSDIVAGRRTNGVSTEADAPTALAQLLHGTGLTFQQTDTGTLLVVRADDPQSGSAAGDGAEGTVEALIVTAQKREEDIQDVPIAISAFTQEALETHQIAGGPDLITQVPNMTFTKTNFSSYSVQIRGIGTQAISATTDPGVAVAFNNTPFVRNRFFEQEFYDLQRVEVLRGPQGTLYGRNATAGVVNIISQKPKFIAEAKLSGDVANYNTTRLEGMVNIPLVEDMVALRLAGAWTKREGYSTNEITGNPIDGRDLWSTRMSLRFSPSDRLDANLIWEHFEEDDDRLRSGKQLCKKDVVTQVGDVTNIPFDTVLSTSGQNSLSAGVQATFSQGCARVSLYSPEAFQTPNGVSVPYYLPLSGIGLPTNLTDPYVSLVQSRDLRVIESTVDPRYRAKADLGELQVSWDITDHLTLASETAYGVDFVWSTQDFNRFNTAPGAWQVVSPSSGPTDARTSGVLDENGVFCDPQVGCSDRLVAVDLSTGEYRQFSQELRLSSDFEGPFNFSLGGNFLRFDGEDKYYVFINSLSLRSALDSTSPSQQYEPGVTDNHECMINGLVLGDPRAATGYNCVYIEQNSIENIQDQGHNYFLSKNPYKLVSYAIFGEAYYNINDNLKVTGGLRYTVDSKRAPRIPSWTLAGNSRGYPVMEVIEQEWREPTGRLAIDWKPDLSFTDETLLYASYAHGYKAGGANPPPMKSIGQDAAYYGTVAPSELRPKTFKAEFVDAFELGSKNTLADGKVTLNLAAFYYDYKDYQISEIVDRSAFNRNFDAEVWGLEIEADWRPLENLKLSFKGGYESTRIADGERAIDLMDRTAGRDDWVLVRPFPTFASSCVLPTWLFAHPGPAPIMGAVPGLYGLGSVGGGGGGGCELAYLARLDPVTTAPYVDLTTYSGPIIPRAAPTLFNWLPGTYPGWDPTADYGNNNGEGFTKELGGNELPNAPNFTASLSADYTLPLPNDWLATLHTDLYWQSESWWRVFNDHEFNSLDEYFTMNLAAIFTNEEAGWKVMAYVKNVFDRDSITGAFLNSDDTALTTNVFLTEPRLYGLRVTKEWTGVPLLGSFGQRRDGPYPFEIELGGQVQRHDAPNVVLAPGFIGEFSDGLNPLANQQDDLDWGDGREVKMSWHPRDAWTVSAGVRFGKTNGSMPWAERRELGDRWCRFYAYFCNPLPPELANYQFDYDTRDNYTVSSTTDREEHTLVDFVIGRDFGFGGLSQSRVSAGLRYAALKSTTEAHIFGTPNWNIPADENAKYEIATHDEYDARLSADREFKGAGPVVAWEAATALFGHQEAGFLMLDWSVAGGVLFGESNTTIEGQATKEEFADGVGSLDLGVRFPDAVLPLPAVNERRAHDVTVPTFGASLGISYEVDRFSIGAGYRWERYQDAIDGGYAETQEEDRTIDGPYFKLSVGFGG